ncbi:MAG: PP2C family protein-serine/threonine phosphatase, partial [bacterium]
AIVGFLAFTLSKQEIESVALELLRAQTERAYEQCEHHFEHSGEPTQDMATAIHRVKIANAGYIFVFSYEGNIAKLVIHPSDVGMRIDSFPHIRQVMQEIAAAGRENGTSGLISYSQGTDARGRQGEKKIGYYIYFAPWKWVLMASAYEKDLYARAETVRNRVIQVIILVGLVSLILINFIVIRVFRPMRRLISATDAVAAGNLDTSISIESKDEIGGLAKHINRMLANIKENTRVWQELEIARRLQTEMLPDGQPKLPGVRIEAKSIPATEVGGDFYDFIALDENRFAIVIGDVSGRGISGAIGMSSAISALRFAADISDSTDQILELANRRLVRDTQSYMFIAVFLAIYDRKQKKLFYTNAGQTMPILLKNGQVDFLQQSKADQFPLGIRPEVKFGETAIDIETGDLLICYTDGIVEMMNGESELYGFERFKQAIGNHSQENLSQMLSSLISDVQAYSGNKEHADDVTLVLIKFD